MFDKEKDQISVIITRPGYISPLSLHRLGSITVKKGRAQVYAAFYNDEPGAENQFDSQWAKYIIKAFDAMRALEAQDLLAAGHDFAWFDRKPALTIVKNPPTDKK